MKRIFGTLLSLAALMTAFSCNDAEYGVGKVRAFLAESTSETGVNGTIVKLTENGAEAKVTITLTGKAPEDVSFKLVMDESVLETYNAEQSSGYVLLPAGSYTLPSEPVQIKKGEYSADPVVIKIGDIPEESKGTPLGLPLKIEKVSGSVETTSTTSKHVLAIPPVLINDLAQFTGATGLKAENFGKSFPNAFTIEVRFQVSDTGNRNRDVFSGGSVLFRFEDPQSDQGDVKAHSAVQFQGSPAYINPDPLIGFATNVWQHLAFTWDGSTGILYYNGAQVGTKAITSGDVGNGDFPSIGWFGGSSGGSHGTGDQWWGNCKIMFTEARIWSVCRTPNQISSNISAVAADSEGLEGYWRINKSTYDEATKSFADLTGNGNNLVTEKSFVWNEGISSEDSKTEWK